MGGREEESLRRKREVSKDEQHDMVEILSTTEGGLKRRASESIPLFPVF